MHSAAGFADIRVWKNFTTETATEADKLFIVIGVRT